MSGMQDREQNFELKFAHDEESKFKILARRNTLFGFWLADQLGIEKNEEMDDFTEKLLNMSLDAPGDATVINFALAKLKEKEIEISEHRLHRNLKVPWRKPANRL
jgi:hypothetical protein